MNKKIIMLSIPAIILSGIWLTNQKTQAYRGELSVKGPNYTVERHTAMVKAFETNDYNAWKNLMKDSKGRVKEKINANNFATFAKMHKLELEGKKEEAAKIRAELGLGQRERRGRGR